MDAINGLMLLLSFSVVAVARSVVLLTSCHIWSEARPDPPPLSMRSNIALMSSFSLADLMALIIVSSPIVEEPEGPGLLFPDTMPPTA